MRRAFLSIGFAAIMACVCAQTMGADKTFYSSGQILPGEVWDDVYIKNDNTIVDMLGGQIGSLITRDFSTFNMSDGQINIYVNIGTLGTTHISNGELNIGDFVFFKDSYGLLSGGNVNAITLKTYLGSELEFAGGILNFDVIDIHGELTIKGGDLHVNSAYINPYPNESIAVNVYGYGFDYDPTGGIYGNGILTGYLLDNNFFSIDELSESELQYFNLIPEPSTLLLLGLGGLFLRKRR